MSDTNKNASSLDNQAGKNKDKLLKEDEYYSKVNEIKETIPLSKRIGIFFSSHKKITFAFIFVSYIVPLFLLFASLVVETAGEAFFDFLNSTIFGPFDTIEDMSHQIISFFSSYIYYVDFLWLIDLISFGYFDLNAYFSFLMDFFENNLTLTFLQSQYFTLLIIGLSTFLFNFALWLSLSYYFIPEHYWKGKGTIFDFYISKMQKAMSESSTLIDSEVKEKAMNKAKSYKKKIISELKKYTNEEGVIVKNEKILQVLPAYKVAFERKDSILGNSIASITNKKWLNTVKTQTTIEDFGELKVFLLEAQFKPEQQEILLNLNWESSIEDTFPSSKKEEVELENKIKNNKKFAKLYKKYMMQYLMVIKYFKNYPIYSAIRFLATKGIVFNKSETLIITNGRKILLNQLEDKKKILDLNLDLTLPNIKDKEVKKKLILDYSKFTNENKKMLSLLENAAKTEVLWEPDTDFKYLLSDYHTEYIKILQFFIKSIFVNYNIEYSDYFEKNIEEVFYEYFAVDNTEHPLIQISPFKVVRLEFFYAMLDMVMKRETVYNVNIRPLYIEYFNQLKIKEILYGKENK